jgi:multiple sugar transport system ATP-binding protein
VRKAAEILQIAPLLDRRPRQLSGGQKQRVAIGRAIVREPKIFLFDEPLSNLDAELRVQTRVEIAKLHTDIGATMVYVTHDQVEAMTLADRIVVLRAGVVEQHGTPLEIYNKPANRFVAGFIGSPKMNFLDVVATGHDNGRIRIALAGTHLAVPVERPVAAGEKLTLGLRPEHILTAAGSDIDLGVLSLVHVEQLGGQTIAYGRLADGQALTVVLDGQHRISARDTLRVGAASSDFHLFGSDGLRLNS